MSERESVWDYPRPPRLERCVDHITVRFADAVIADTRDALRVLETSHPPVYYLPPRDIQMTFIEAVAGQSLWEFKGRADYVSIVANRRRSERAGWRYENPSPTYSALKGYIAFYASRVDEALVGADVVMPQAGDFYGGWITANIDGPFKGAPGTSGW